MNWTTAYRLLPLKDPPTTYASRKKGSLVDPYKEQIAALLDENERTLATVILLHIRKKGHGGGITILRDHLANVRPEFLAVRAYQRTSYHPGRSCSWPGGSLLWIFRSKKATHGVRGLRQRYPTRSPMPAYFPSARPWPIFRVTGTAGPGRSLTPVTTVGLVPWWSRLGRW